MLILRHDAITRFWQRWSKPGFSLFGGIILVGFLSIILRPIQLDSAHVIGFFNPQGGSVMHPAEFDLYRAFAGDYTLIITGKLTGPIKGDIQVDLAGDHPVNFTTFSRNPPIFPLFNYSHNWYRYNDGFFQDVSSGDNLIIYMKLHLPIEAGEYQASFTNPQTNQVYLSVPISFKNPVGLQSSATSGEDCH